PGVPVISRAATGSAKMLTMATAKPTAAPVIAPKRAEAKRADEELDEPTHVEPGRSVPAQKSTIMGMPAATPPRQPMQPPRPPPQPTTTASSPVKKAPIISVGAQKDEPTKAEPKIGSFPLPGGGMSKPGVISKVQTDVPAAPGPTVDPMEWFDEKGSSKSQP